MEFIWHQIQNVGSKNYNCGYCGNPLASEKGYIGQNHRTGQNAYIYVCHQCEKPTFFDVLGRQTPGVRYGKEVFDIYDDGVKNLYTEARDSYSANAFTATVLCCRKLLMHIAVSKGAKENLKFIEYVEFLSDNNFIPPGAKDWVEYIRKKGNEANHEILIMKDEDAKDLLSFMEMLLKIIYEFPANIKRKSPQTEQQGQA